MSATKHGEFLAGKMLVVAAALVDAKGRVLVQQRAGHRSMPGLWEFPGGKCEPGETPEGALVRELAEELGIEAEETRLAPAAFASARVADAHMILLLYVLREWRGDPRPLDSDGLRWLRPADLHTLAMPPADKPLIGALEALV
ncbi:MAG: (deoxy)nucleoside triphosphate pyrophosphohydrolase [Sphingomonadaceae bacterium]|nr:(deoxy)nucleoside triphosphate pyrophosphohydrolase [Sphingomonadaceae bacterium]